VKGHGVSALRCFGRGMRPGRWSLCRGQCVSRRPLRNARYSAGRHPLAVSAAARTRAWGELSAGRAGPTCASRSKWCVVWNRVSCTSAQRRVIGLTEGVVSSVGRASRLHRECRGFESLTTHHFPAHCPFFPAGYGVRRVFTSRTIARMLAPCPLWAGPVTSRLREGAKPSGRKPVGSTRLVYSPTSTVGSDGAIKASLLGSWKGWPPRRRFPRR
jgi:hypothetical protein